MSTFDPTMPHALAVPWSAEIFVIYDLYRCEKYMDDEPTVLAETEKVRRRLSVARIDIDRRIALVEAANAAALGALGVADDPTVVPAPPPATPEMINGLAQRRLALDALQAERDAWSADKHAWELQQCICQARYFVVAVRYPDGTEYPGKDPATWSTWPLAFMDWVANKGYDAAREALWPAPKAPTSSLPMPSAAPIELDT